MRWKPVDPWIQTTVIQYSLSKRSPKSAVHFHGSDLIFHMLATRFHA